MRINQVVVIPKFRNDGNLGECYERFNQFDAVEAYVNTLCEFLDHDRVSFSRQTEADPIYPNSLVVHCSIGWSDKQFKRHTPPENSSVVYYNQQRSRVFADIMHETLGEWGKCYVQLAHKVRELKHDEENPVLNVENTMAVKIEPFLLNCEKREEYIHRAPALGRLLAHCIYEYMLSRNEQPKMMGTGYL